MTELLASAQWFCASTSPGAIEAPDGLERAGLDWIPAQVPGTAAAALRAAGLWHWGEEDADVLDGRDWWFRARFARGEEDGPWELALGGLATLADVWLGDRHLVHSENMFVSHTVEVDTLAPVNELTVRCASLQALLQRRHPPPPVKKHPPRPQGLRWYRTTLLGRMPGWSRWAAPVGPWRPVTLRARPAHGTPRDLRVQATCLPGGGGRVAVSLLLDGTTRPAAAALDVDGTRASLTVTEEAGAVRVSGQVTLDRVERWWPHTHGPQPLSSVTLGLDDEWRPLRRVGFRTIELDRSDGGFALRVNGEPCFCRGVTWGPADGVALTAPRDQPGRDLGLARAAGLNLIRLGGYGVYEDARFWDRCDELGIMVWQDCMVASVDLPDAPEFLATFAAELREQFGALAGRPALVMTCGASESYQQGAMLGLAPERYRSTVLEEWIPDVLAAVVPDVPYIPSSPSGGEPPIRVDEGVAHYFGVGAYLRPVSDARLADVRFAAECLSFGNPPERETVAREYGSALVAGHDPRWKLAVARDAGTSWDFEDIRDHYVAQLFDVDARVLRYRDPERALDLGRAAVVEVIGTVLGGWRAPASRCAGAIVLAWRDLWPGAGWGMLDALGTPKAVYYALARASRPTALTLRDLGLNGLALDLHNDAPVPLEGELALTLFDSAGRELETGAMPVVVGAHGGRSLDANALLSGFRDLTSAYRFSPSGPDVVLAQLRGADGHVRERGVHLVGGCARPLQADAGLRAVARRVPDGRWSLTVSTERVATFVCVDVPGRRPSDSWFHLAPRESLSIDLPGEERPAGTVRALNAEAVASIAVQEP